MARQDDFLTTLTNAKLKAEKEWSASLPLAAWWRITKTLVVQPIFEDAVTALQNAGYDNAEQMGKNGAGILLQVGNPCLSLTFNLDGDGVKATFSEGTGNTLWDDRNELTEDAVLAKVNELLEAVVRQTIWHRDPARFPFSTP
jgi:hypothetical protein